MRLLPLFFLLILPITMRVSAASSPATVYRHVTLLDVARGTQRSNMMVLVQDDRITKVAADDGSPPLAGTKQYDLSGKYMIPGLVDAHVHIATPPDRRQAEAILRRDLYGGVTSVRDMADDLRQVSDLARAALVGEIPAPDIYYAAVFAGPIFFSDPRTHQTTMGAIAGKVPWMQAIDRDSDLRMCVALARGTSATAIKLYADLSPELARKATEEAHRQGMKVWAHATLYPARPQEVVAAGVDSISHVGMLVFAALPPIQGFRYYAKHPQDLSSLELIHNPVFPKLFKQMHERHVVLDATLKEELDAYQESADRPKHRGFPAPALVTQLLMDAHHNAIDIDAGTDFVDGWESLWPEVYEEMTALSKAGLTNAEVLRSATFMGARVLGQESNVGSIEAGKLADFVVLRKDPLQNLENLRTIDMVVKRGHGYARADFKPLVHDDIVNQ